MGRETRKVTKDWIHPKNDKGNFIPLLYNNGSFLYAYTEWMIGFYHWQKGLREASGSENRGEWIPVDESISSDTYEEWAGSMPSPEDYMPDWQDEECTHFMMYEDTTEGTPISPAFETIEELASWLASNNASSFAERTATYEQWLNTCKKGRTCSGVIANNQLVSGVEYFSE